MCYTWVLVFLLSCGLRFGDAVPCNIYLNDASDPVPNWGAYPSIGNFRKDVVTDSLLPGYIRMEGLTAGQMKPTTSGLCRNPEYFTPDTTIPNEVHFKVTDQFQGIDAENVGNNDPGMQCLIILELDISQCDDASGNSINLRFGIEDFNTNDPEFLGEPYIFNVAAPLIPGLSLSALTDVLIRAKDIDISTNTLIFTVDGDNRFDFKNTKGEGSKIFNSELVLVNTELVYLQQDLEISITVNDAAKVPSPKQTSTKVNIVLDKTNSMPPTPQFTESFQSGEFKASDLVLNAPLDHLSIALKEEYLNLDVALTAVSGTADPHFRAERTGTKVDILYIQEYTEGDPAPDILTLLVTAEVTTFGKTTSQSTVLQLIFTDNPTTESTTSTTTESTTDDTTSSTTESNTDTTDPDDPEDDDKGDDGVNTGLMVGLIVVAVIAGLLLIAMGYMYVRYIRGMGKGQHKKQLQHEEGNQRLGHNRPGTPPVPHRDTFSGIFNEGARKFPEVENNVKSFGEREFTTPTIIEEPQDSKDVKESKVPAMNVQIEVNAHKDNPNVEPVAAVDSMEPTQHSLYPSLQEVGLTAEEHRTPISLDSLISDHEDSLKPAETKTRKRSQTFSVTDEEARLAREGGQDNAETSDIADTTTTSSPVRKKSVVTFQGLE